MSIEPSRSEFPLEVPPRQWSGAFAPNWYLRLRLGLARQGIDRLQRELAGEFASLDTAPLHEEIAALTAERDRLLQRLAGRA